MRFALALVFYIILFLAVLAATWKMGIHPFSAVVVAALISVIFLMILVPPSDIDKYADDLVDGCADDKNGVAVGLFMLIYLVTLVLVVWYVLVKADQDRIPIHDN